MNCQPKFDSRYGHWDFLVTVTFTSAGPIHSPVRRMMMTMTFFAQVKQPWRERNSPLLPSVEVKSAWSCASSLHTPKRRGARRRD
jgi:hypothetical protein